MACQGLVAEGRKAVNANQLSNARKMTSATITVATAVAPLSPRARPGATVSMPLTSNQVRTDLDPKRFTIRTVPALLRDTSAWSDYDEGARLLAPAIKRFQRSTRKAA